VGEARAAATAGARVGAPWGHGRREREGRTLQWAPERADTQEVARQEAVRREAGGWEAAPAVVAVRAMVVPEVSGSAMTVLPGVEGSAVAVTVVPEGEAAIVGW